MTGPGRNDPCPCGSGQKYKKCCLARREAEATALRPAHLLRETVFGALLQFGSTAEFDNDHNIAQMLFWSDRLDGCDEEQARELWTSEDVQVKYNCFFVFDLDIDDGQTVADMFLRRRGRSLSAEQRGYLDRMRASHLRLYEVQDVEAGAGLHLLDLWTKATVYVHERAATADLVRWDVLGARVVPDGDGRLLFEGGLYLYPADARRTLLRDFRTMRRRYRRDFPAADDAAFFKRHSMMFHHAWLDLVALRPLPKVVTAEGDEMVFASVVFDVRDGDALRAALSVRGDADVQADGSAMWIEPAGEEVRALGTLRLDGARAVLETTSRARAERGRAWLAAVGGPAVSYRTTAYESVPRRLERSRGSAVALPPSNVPPDIEAEIVEEMMTRHYRAWLDERLPALKGHTPREAARSKTLRPLVTDLLKGLDNRSARMEQRGKPRFDSAWIWSELGLRRP